MQIRDAQIVRLIEHIGEHYRTNISNRYVRPLLLQIALDKQTWDLIEILTEKVEQFRYQGFHLDELYRQIAAAARFVAVVRRDLVPGLRNRRGIPDVSGPNKVLRDMAVNNFGSNLQVFADLVNELYIKLVDMDKLESKGHMPLYAQMPELREIGRQLVGN
ncbi:MAG: hypothetical protein LBP32_08655 [Spirochaetaceae bacterium]|jgi:hypothetical protein|nr:hypothetical protein [Spirochaetaceae bacterium]